MKKHKILILIFILVFSFIGCNNENESEKKKEEIYQLAKTSGYTGSYEDWLNTIQGIDESLITKVEFNNDGELIITLSNGQISNLGAVNNTDSVGIKNVYLNENDELIIAYMNGQTKNLGKIISNNPYEGNGIKNVEINQDGELVFTLTDDTKTNIGIVKGTDGVGIKDIYVNVSGSIIVELTNGTSKNLGKVGTSSSTVEGIVPVYEGMTLEGSSKTKINYKKTKGIDNQIYDYLNIIETEKIEYYASKNELFNVVIHLYNPSSYEILSLTLNNHKYQSYEFKDGSTSTKLIVEVEAGQISGLKEFTIDSIKYVDGTEIKDVKMDGERTVKAGIKYDIVPTASTISEEVETVSFNTVVEIKDDIQLMNQTEDIHFFVFDDQSIVSHQQLQLGINSIEVDNLLMGTDYEYVVVGVYDDCSGQGKQANPLIESSFTTLDGFTINSLESTQDSIKVDLNNENMNANFVKAELYLDNELVSTIDNYERLLFENLLSNREYEIKITYSYSKEDVDRKNCIEKKVKTQGKTLPTFSINNLNKDKKSITYKIEESDIDNTKVAFKAYLYNGASKVEEKNELEGTFENILSNTQYEIIFEYSYDLGDGLGVVTEKKNEFITTASIEEPTIDISYSKKSDSLSYIETRIDNDNVINNVIYKLYRGSVLIAQSEEKEGIFENLSSNTEYKLEITYKFDLNDGLGEQTRQKTYNVLLSKEVPSIEVTTYLITQNEVEYNVLITDPNAVGRVNMIALYVDNTFLKRLDDTTTSIDNLSTNTAYNIRINYVYDLDDGNGSKEINYKYEFTTLKEEPSVEINLSTITKDSISFTYNIVDSDNALEFKQFDLYHNGEVIKTNNNISDISFTELLCDNEYQIAAVFEKDLNNGITTLTAYASGKTLALAKPLINIELSSTKTEIQYNYTLTDSDNISTFKSVDLYYQGTKLNSVAVDNKFSNLYTDSEYEVVITVLNDYKNGQPAVEETYSQKVKTESHDIPSLSVELTSTQDTINYNIEYADVFNLIKVNKVSVLKNNNVVKENTDLNVNKFNNLTSNTRYTIKVDYQYNLNNNQGVVNQTVYKEYSTLAYNVKVKGYEILNSTNPKTNEIISIKLNLENLSKIKLEYLVVNNKKVDIVGGDYYNNVVFTITTPKESGDFQITANKMGYILNDLEVEQAVETDVDITIDVMTRLDIISIDTVDHSGVYKNHEYYSNCFIGDEIVTYKPINLYGYVITIDNPNGYEIKSYTLEKEYSLESIECEVKMIDKNHAYFCLEDSLKNFTISSVKYINEKGKEAKRNYTNPIKLDISIIDPDADTGAIVVHQVSTPEELMNMKEKCYYELTCDIDLTGYKWTPYEFIGYLDGKGYTISNLSVIEENEYNETKIGIFLNNSYDNYPTIKNVYFDNLYFNIDTNGTIYSSIISSYNDIYSNVSNTILENIVLTGDINVTGNQEYNRITLPTGTNVYYVDHFNLNGNSLVTNENLISYEAFNSDEFKTNTLGWNFKDKEYFEKDGLTYMIIDNSYILITGYNGTSFKLIIPETIDGLPVIGVVDLAFENNKTLKSVTLSENLMFVGNSILKGCSNLEELIIELDYDIDCSYLCKFFGKTAFDNSYQVTSLSIYDNDIYYLPSNLKTLIVRSNKIKEVSQGAFFGCSSLTSITIPDSVISICGNTFGGCSSLISITIPDSVTSIGGGAFSGCSNITSITIPNSVTSIGERAFSRCSSLTSITIPEGVTSIGDWAFYDCSSLTSITIPDSVASIGNGAFNGCWKLTSITIPESVTSIGDYAFQSCSNLTSITIGNSVTSIGDCAFDGCENLTSITIPDSVTSIEGWAFSGCSSLTSITIPDSVTSIGDYAFQSCSNLTSITIGNSVTSIGDYAFNGCNNLIEITLSNSVISIGNSAFVCCYNLENVYFDGTLEEWNSITFKNESSNPMYHATHLYVLDATGK